MIEININELCLAIQKRSRLDRLTGTERGTERQNRRKPQQLMREQISKTGAENQREIGWLNKQRRWQIIREGNPVPNKFKVAKNAQNVTQHISMQFIGPMHFK